MANDEVTTDKGEEGKAEVVLDLWRRWKRCPVLSEVLMVSLGATVDGRERDSAGEMDGTGDTLWTCWMPRSASGMG